MVKVNGEAAMDLTFIALVREGQSHKRLSNAGAKDVIVHTQPIFAMG